MIALILGLPPVPSIRLAPAAPKEFFPKLAHCIPEGSYNGSTKS